MKTIPTAEKMLKEYQENAQIQGIDFTVIIFNDALRIMQKFTKLHLEAQKEAILKELERCDVDLTKDIDYEKSMNSIIENAYNIENNVK